MNPNSIVSIYGEVTEKPKFYKDNNGNEFAARFDVSVKRNYRNKHGKYTDDLIPVKYVFNDPGRQTFAHFIKQGAQVLVVGTLKTNSGALYVESDSVSFDNWTRMNMDFTQETPDIKIDRNDKGQDKSAGKIILNDFIVDCSMPYSPT